MKWNSQLSCTFNLIFNYNRLNTLGRQYDGVGNAAQWWSDETIAAFEAEAQCYIDQYDAYVIPELEPILGSDAHVRHWRETTLL